LIFFSQNFWKLLGLFYFLSPKVPTRFASLPDKFYGRKSNIFIASKGGYGQKEINTLHCKINIFIAQLKIYKVDMLVPMFCTLRRVAWVTVIDVLNLYQMILYYVSLYLLNIILHDIYFILLLPITYYKVIPIFYF